MEELTDQLEEKAYALVMEIENEYGGMTKYDNEHRLMFDIWIERKMMDGDEERREKSQEPCCL